MSLHLATEDTIPEHTALVAHAAFPKGTTAMRIRDFLGTVYADDQFQALYSPTGQPAYSPGRLALITILQFLEGLSDRQAADAVRGRIDWKYALALDLTDPGFDASVLCEFRSRLLTGHHEETLFTSVLDRLRAAGLLTARGKQRTDSTHVLAAITKLNRLECIGETVRHALNVLATVAPDWMLSWIPQEWAERYAHRFEEYRLPAKKEERYALASVIGADGLCVLTHVDQCSQMPWLQELPAIIILRHIWIQQFYATAPDTVPRWREADDLPPASLLISSPYDEQARWSRKRETTWTGYKVHVTETCDEDSVHLITHVETTSATTADSTVLPRIHVQLATRDLLPQEHLVDMGFMATDHLLDARERHVTLIGPLREDCSWQTRAGEGYGVACFAIDWQHQHAKCPQGHISQIWKPGKETDGHDIVEMRFAHRDCGPCPVRQHCVSSTRPRALRVRLQEVYEASTHARRHQTTEAFKTAYAQRAGIEGTLSQGVRRGDLRRTRYIGLPKTHLQHLMIATALNLLRVGEWLIQPRLARTRVSPFKALTQSAA